MEHQLPSLRYFYIMLVCEVNKIDQEYAFKCIDDSGQTILESRKFKNKQVLFKELSKYNSSGYRDYVYEICDDEECYYFKILDKGVILLESSLFEDRQSVYDYTEFLKGGCMISHLIDNSFEEGKVYYYLTCTSNLKFKAPLKINLEKEDGDFVGSINALNIFSFSTSLSEVIEELKNDIEDLYDTLFIEESNLSPKAQEIKKTLNSNLVLSGI